ncbi:hypothetical protein [Kocuria rosea]|uniref:hypothetical protein n=1 Tax=Kocuria rosea TaxID=1275 RepID=UPI000F8469AC
MGGEHIDALVQVSVGDGLGQAEVAGQVGNPSRVTVPAKQTPRLGPSGVGPLVRAGSIGRAVVMQQAREEIKGFDRHVAG